jgi:hypothetical protein
VQIERFASHLDEQLEHNFSKKNANRACAGAAKECIIFSQNVLKGIWVAIFFTDEWERGAE